MKALFVATLPPRSPTIIGRTLPLARAVEQHGHGVGIVTLGHNQDGAGDTGVPVRVVGPALRGPEAGRPPLPTILRRLHAGARALADALAKERADVVVVVKPHPQNVWAARRASRPLILDADDDERWASRLSWMERAVMARIERHAARRATLVTACSPALVRRFAADLRAPRVELVPTGIASSRETASVLNLRARLGLDARAEILLYVGSIALASGHRVDHVLEAWETLADERPALHLAIAGDGIDTNRIRERAARKRHADRIHFLGRFSPPDAEGMARQATLLVDPADRSPAAEAKSSFRTLLALKTGVPVVAGDVGVRRMFLPPSIHRWALYEPGNRDALLAGLREGLTKRAREEFQRETSGLWNQWSWDRIGARFTALLEEIAP